MNKRVALIANGWNGENLDNFIEGFNAHFENHDVDLFIFSSLFCTGYSPALIEAEDSIYDLPDYSFFDAAVIFRAGINSDESLEHIVEKFKTAGVPVVLQGCDLDGASSVMVDNSVGMKNLCEHLIEKHGVSDVVYIAGDENSVDSNIRMQVLKDVLEAHGYKLPDENIFYALWDSRIISSFIFETYGKGKKKLPDAFVCANDKMALSVLTFLKELNVKLPEDVIVTGYDNISGGQGFYPSLSTVDQRYYDQGCECAKIVSEAFADSKIVKKIVVPTILCPGESCGCFDCKGEEELRKKMACASWANQYIGDVMQGRKTHLDNCIMSNERPEEIHGSMNADFLKSIGQETEDFHIYINPQYRELKYKSSRREDLGGTFYNPVMDVYAARTDGTVFSEDTIQRNQLFLGYEGTGKGKTYVFVPLLIDESAFGYMVMGYKEQAYEKRKYIEFANFLGTTFNQYQKNIENYYRAIEIKEQAKNFLEQTAEALASAIDANDSYTHGHSARVAKYAKQIGKLSGASKEECDDIYLAGLLHDVGKIGIDNSIINKAGKLTDDEYAIIKQHPALGDAILAKIHMSPSLSIGARHHHERYDGRGYPDGLMGTDIPKLARIIAVADAYDAMTSKRSYRDIIPQMKVREELEKGLGTQFDPEYAKIMIKLLDQDKEYKMREM